MLEHITTFDQVALLLLMAAAIGVVALWLRQPLVISFVVVGIIAGPSVLGWVQPAGPIEFLAELGLALLLFVVGLKLDIGEVRSMGSVALSAGLLQVLITGVIAFGLAAGLGFATLSSIYIAAALTFSSTIIIIKLLSDKREDDSLHGRIVIGVLIVQDIIVVLGMILLSATAGAGGDLGKKLLLTAGTGVLLAIVLIAMTRFVFPKLLGHVARAPELLVLFAISWAVVVAGAAEMLGFSKEVGAFLAGISLAPTAYRDLVAARLVSLRDFLLLFFFIQLGTRFDPAALGTAALLAIPISIFVLIGKPILMMAILGQLGYQKRAFALAGISIGQISEFSLILAALGVRLGHLDARTAGLMTLVGMVTIGASTYIINSSHSIYNKISPYLGWMERRSAYREIADVACPIEPPEVILFGLGRYGSAVAERFIEQERNLLGVDFDPKAVREWTGMGRAAYYGDAGDPEFVSRLPLDCAKWVISSLRDSEVNSNLIASLQARGFTGGVAVTADDIEEVDSLKSIGADIVFYPFTDAATEAANIIMLADEEEARRQMEKTVSQLKDHYIVCGYGRMGKQIVKDFSRLGVPFVVVEFNPDQLPKLREDGVPRVEGIATDDETLLTAGVMRAKGLIAVTATDEENVFIVLSARVLNPTLYIIARSIRHENEDKLRRAGADRVTSPYVVGGHRIANAVLHPHVTDFLDLMISSEDVDVDIRQVTISDTSNLAGKKLRESQIRESTGATVLAVFRGKNMTANPSPDFMIEAGDVMVVMGTQQQVRALDS